MKLWIRKALLSTLSIVLVLSMVPMFWAVPVYGNELVGVEGAGTTNAEDVQGSDVVTSVDEVFVTDSSTATGGSATADGVVSVDGSLSIDGSLNSGDTADSDGSLGSDTLSTDENAVIDKMDAMQKDVLVTLGAQSEDSYVSDEVIVAFKDTANPKAAGSLLANTDSVNTEDLSTETFSTDAALTENIVAVPLAEGTSVRSAIIELSQDPNVESVEPNYIFEFYGEMNYGSVGDENASGGSVSIDGTSSTDMTETSAVTTTPATAAVTVTAAAATSTTPVITTPATAATTTTGDFNAPTVIDDPDRSAQWALTTTKTYDAWSLARADRRVSVAVIDSGVDTTHPDLKNNIVAGSYYDAAEIGQTGDSLGHGTHVAGIIAAEANNGIGVAGVSYNAKIVPINVANTDHKPTLDALIKAYQYLLSDVDVDGMTVIQEYNIKAINVSIGFTGSGVDANFSPILNNLIDRTYNAGALTFASTGNDGPDYVINYPAVYDRTIAVAACKKGLGTNNDPVDDYSTRGSYIDIAAPGTNIYSTVLNGYYGHLRGTSMAAPFVAGVAAMLWGASPTLSCAQMRNILEVTASDLVPTGKDDLSGYGEIDPYAAALKVTGDGFGYLDLSYQTHVENVGWMNFVDSGSVAGTTGRNLQIEALRVNLTNNTGFGGGIQYKTHVQNVGWMGYTTVNTTGTGSAVARGGISGTTGKALQVEGVAMQLTGTLSTKFDIYYRVHVSNIGWMNWGKNGQEAGSVGHSLQVEAIQVVVLPKGTNGTSTPPVASYGGVVTAAGMPRLVSDEAAIASSMKFDATAYVQGRGSVSYVSATGKTILGTEGQSRRMETMTFTGIDKPNVSGALRYSSHVQDYGWEGVKLEGAQSGQRGKRIEAVRIRLDGVMYQNYDVYYRAHVENIGWTGWAKNDQSCGSAGYSYRLEALQVVIVPKGDVAPGSGGRAFY